jgi:5-methyltetrahydropteroyltriglutamate--homocysteine methyltransferase
VTRGIQTTHVGSLLRPPELMPALRAAERGEPYDRTAFAAAADAHVAEAVRRQCEIGIDVVDDGEISKVGFIAYTYERVGGIEARVVRRPARTPTRARAGYARGRSRPTPSRPGATSRA